MKIWNASCLLAALLFLIPSLARAQDAAEDQEEIKAAWHNFIEARKKGDGAEAVKYVSAGTLQRMADTKDLALNGSAEAVKAKPISTKTEVLELRFNIPRQELSVMTAEQLCQRYFSQPLKQQNEVQLKSIKVAGTQAAVEMDAGITLGFVKENGAWKIDWPSYIGYADKIASEKIKEIGQDEDAFIVDALALVTKKKPDPGIWDAAAYK